MKLASGYHIHVAEEFLKRYVGASCALLTTSCTDALEMSAILCDVKPGDEVILPSFTFVSTANAFLLRGATLKFIDIKPDTLNLDEEKLPELITDKTKCIVPVHYAGRLCNMGEINKIAKATDCFVIEDAAQAIGTFCDGKSAGSFGNLSAFSFHETKNINCGEGGALLVNDRRMVERAEIIRDKGTNRSQFNKKLVSKYTWVDIGSSFVPSELNAAMLSEHLKDIDYVNNARLNHCRQYMNNLKELETEGHFRLPQLSQKGLGNGHIFYIILDKSKNRNEFIEFLKGHGIQASFHYVPLHNSPMGEKLGTNNSILEVTEEIAKSIVRLPLYVDLKKFEIDYICDVITQFFHAHTSNVRIA